MDTSEGSVREGLPLYGERQGNTRLTERCEYLVRRPDEVFLADISFPQIAKAQRWLQGEDAPEPDVVKLSHAVNGYNRVPGFGEGGNEWVEDRLPPLTGDGAAELKTQELLDLLFLFCRKDRFAEGTLDDLADEVEAIMGVLRERVDLGRRDNRTQEERLRAPFFIPYRAPKDPREIEILNPACGSGHFLLYCFDLLQTIYEEAYDDGALGQALQVEYPDRQEFRRAVPALILRRNLHGIDIDVRATQIAALALWLRAQRAYGELGLKDDERPRITRSNIVCAEPMPGEREMMEAFLADVDPRLRPLVRTIWEKMKLADEAGFLLKIEEEISDAIARARQESMADLQIDPSNETSAGSARQGVLELGTPEKRAFWDDAEEYLLHTLEEYARQADNGSAYRRLLFADDAAQGFAFVDICRKRFDVVLMNPPFGDASKPSKAYIEKNYPRTKNDVYAAFVERGLDWLHPGGLLGAITSRTGFFLSSFRKWREEIVLGEARPTVVADLGQGVLDTAMVETAAYALEKAR